MMPKSIRRICRFFSALISLGVIASAVVLGGTAFLNAPPSDPPVLGNSPPGGGAQGVMRLDEGGALIIEVRPGETAHSVGARLERAGIIRSRYFWNALARLSGDHIRAGTYRIDLPASQLNIRSTLTSGGQFLVRVTVPEGLTLRQTAQLFEEAGVCAAGDFLAAAASREILDAFNVPGQTMEGYLFPDTYLFPLSYPAARVVSAMADNFFRRLALLAPQSASMTPAQINERVIMASIVEREYRVREEAAIMAGVFFNRLQHGWRLQSCATVVYVMTEILGQPHPHRLLYRDLEIASPFNTYQQPGLPPAPIASPGETALRAAFDRAETSYFFFRLIDPADGRHFFARTLEEHNMAGARLVGR
ncbi:MAG: endolytic transglycosylase MltG [Treponema sp.]|nr:endolytic transglycosylase MltG [Treponema sp.]